MTMAVTVSEYTSCVSFWPAFLLMNNFRTYRDIAWLHYFWKATRRMDIDDVAEALVVE